MLNMNTAYFSNVAQLARRFIADLKLAKEPPQDLDSTTVGLRARMQPMCLELGSQIRVLETERLRFKGRMGKGATGLNTVGMLCDRLTILLMKEWSIENRGKWDSGAARALRETQTDDIINALELAVPGSASTPAKITHLRGGASAEDWAAAFCGLLAANVLLWESQELLYTRDIDLVSSSELRTYIKWFAKGNMERNEYIQLSERHFWSTE